eukprot:6471111-Amphidinium_carterae.1
MATAGPEEPEEEPEWIIMSPTSPSEPLIPVSNGHRLPTRLSAQSLLRGDLYIPYTGEAYVVWTLQDSPYGAHEYCGIHFGQEPWQGIMSLTESGRYTARLHHLRRVRHPSYESHSNTRPLSNLVWSGVHLYASESARHHCNRYVRLWEWR